MLGGVILHMYSCQKEATKTSSDGCHWEVEALNVALPLLMWVPVTSHMLIVFPYMCEPHMIYLGLQMDI